MSANSKYMIIGLLILVMWIGISKRKAILIDPEGGMVFRETTYFGFVVKEGRVAKRHGEWECERAGKWKRCPCEVMTVECEDDSGDREYGL